MFLVTVAILSVIIGLIRKGSLANIIQSDIKASFLFILSLLLFIAVQVGDSAGIAFITDWMYFIRLAAYCLLLLGIILNLNVWMFILLLGAVMNFVVIFINGGKMPVSESAIQIAGIAATTIQDSSIYTLATAATNFPFLGGIIPIPLPGALAEIISPGIVIMAIGMFGIIQNILLGIVYEYEDDEESEEDEENAEIKENKKSAKKEKRAAKNQQEEDDFFFDDDEDDLSEDADFGKDYTMGNININDIADDDEDIDESIFTTELPILGDGEVSENGNTEKTAEEILDEILNRTESDSEESEMEAMSGVLAEEVEYTEIDEEPETLAENETSESENAEEFDDTVVLPIEEMQPSDEPLYEQEPFIQQEVVDEEEPYYAVGPEEYTIPIDPDALRYADAENSDLTLTNDAILEANDLIENTAHQDTDNIREYRAPQAELIDTDSPFIIVNGRIVENPHYKFKKGTRKETSDDTAQVDSGVYVVRSRNPSLTGKPNFIPPNKRIAEPTTQKQPTQQSSESANQQTDTGYEKVEMKIGDVQIKFWKKDNEDK